MASDQVRVFTEAQLEKLAKSLGDTYGGFTGSEIGHLLDSIGVVDGHSGMTKWVRLYNAFVDDQNKRQAGNKVLSFIAKALDPVRFVDDIPSFNRLTYEINQVLAFQGLEYRDDGSFHKIKSISTLSESQQRVEKLRMTIIERHLDQELLKYCKEELLANDYFHAVQEAIKGLFEIIRQKSGLLGDGADLVDKAFSGDIPKIKINAYVTKTEISEQSGFSNLLKGVYGVFRNPTSHELRSEWPIQEQDALDLFSTLSYLYRRIDK